MRMTTRAAVTAAIAAIGIATGATGASAYGFDPPGTAFTGTNAGLGSHDFSVGGAIMSCTSATFPGTTTSPASGSVDVRPAYGGCTLNAAGSVFAVNVIINSDWTVTVTGGTGPFTGNVSIGAPPSGHAIVIEWPDFACELYIDAQTLTTGLTGANNSSGVAISAAVPGIAYTQNGNCFVASSGTDGSYSGDVNISGIAIAN